MLRARGYRLWLCWYFPVSYGPCERLRLMLSAVGVGTGKRMCCSVCLGCRACCVGGLGQLCLVLVSCKIVSGFLMQGWHTQHMTGNVVNPRNVAIDELGQVLGRCWSGESVCCSEGHVASIISKCSSSKSRTYKLMSIASSRLVTGCTSNTFSSIFLRSKGDFLLN